MKLSTIAMGVCALLAAQSVAMTSQAAPGPATAALSKCLVDSATADDHVVLVKWIFAIVAKHPSVASMAIVTDKQRNDMNTQAGALFTRLMVDDCGAQLKVAVKQDGTDAVGSAFETLGGAAMSDLMGDPSVQAETSKIDSYMDEKKLEKLFKED